MWREMVRSGWALCLAVAVAGCAGSQAVKPAASDAEIVRQRAQERWDALVGGDVNKAYGFLSPGTRLANSLSAYSASVRPGLWKKVVVERVECPEADVCDAHLLVEYAYRGSRIATPMKESWVRSGGEWWYVLK